MKVPSLSWRYPPALPPSDRRCLRFNLLLLPELSEKTAFCAHGCPVLHTEHPPGLSVQICIGLRNLSCPFVHIHHHGYIHIIPLMVIFNNTRIWVYFCNICTKNSLPPPGIFLQNHCIFLKIIRFFCENPSISCQTGRFASVKKIRQKLRQLSAVDDIASVILPL